MHRVAYIFFPRDQKEDSFWAQKYKIGFTQPLFLRLPDEIKEQFIYAYTKLFHSQIVETTTENSKSIFKNFC